MFNEMESFCRKLPKIELHAHLNGSISSTTLKRLGCSEESIAQFQTADTNIEHVFSLFKIAHEATKTTDHLYEATKNVIQEFAEDKVVYLELRTTPRSEETMSEKDYIETVVKAVRETDCSEIMVKLLLSLDRRKSYEDQLKTLDLIINYQKKHPDIIKGVDLSGDPAKGEFFKDLFEKARENNLYTAIHCAEIKNDIEVKNILEFKPDRIGHGTFLHPNYGGCPETWTEYEKIKIPVECCLTSNVVCLTSKSYADHHVQEWMKDSLPFCLATDDKGILKTTLSEEFYHVYKHFNLDKLDLWEISKQSIEYCFASPEEKQFLQLGLEQWKNKHI